MISWLWLIPAFIVGGLVGLLLIALMKAANVEVSPLPWGDL